MRKRTSRAGLVVIAFLVAQALTSGGAADAVSRTECVTDSQESPLTIIGSAPCGIYGILATRRTMVNGGDVDVTVDFAVFRPGGATKALVVLFAGGNGDAGIEGDPDTGQVTHTGNNFLVRSAQIFADLGYLALVLDRSSVAPVPNPEYDQYRISAAHAQDIAAVVSQVNAANHVVFLAGTSRGTLSVVAQYMLGAGSMLSSPVTSPAGTALYIGHPGIPNLQPGFVGVPVHVMTHDGDACFVTTPADAATLYTQFLSAGVDAVLDHMSGGFSVSADVCDALTFHGYLGIENAAIGKIVARMGAVLAQVEQLFPGNRRPRARPATVAAVFPHSITIDLSRLAGDPNQDPLTFSLPYSVSTRGAGISAAGSVVTYTPNQPGITDGFVYVVSDGKRGTSAAVVTVVVEP